MGEVVSFVSPQKDFEYIVAKSMMSPILIGLDWLLTTRFRIFSFDEQILKVEMERTQILMHERGKLLKLMLDRSWLLSAHRIRLV